MNNNIQGVVIDNKHAKNGTLIVRVTRQEYNTFYHKMISTSRVYTVHSASKQDVPLQTKVIIAQCVPISKAKRHIVIGEVSV